MDNTQAEKPPTFTKLTPVFVAIGCGLVTLLILQFVLFIGFVPSESMEPTISSDNSFIMGFRLDKDYQIGDVVIFQKDGAFMVKRIAYKEGDTVLHDGKEITVPPQSYYMLGDNVNNSFDSRYWDEPFVSKDDIKAKVIIPNCELKKVD